MDLDELKLINDRHGHFHGDRVLRGVGEVISTRVRRIDTAARYGGDEFVVALPGMSLIGAQRMADALRRAVESCVPTLAGIGFPRGTLTISVGIASRTFGSDSTTVVDADSETLFRAADRALYAAKNGGRNQTHVA